MNKEVRIAGIIRESIVDGPGIRFVVFCQGCPHRCIGCHNPQTHDFESGNLCSTERLLEEIKKNPLIKGVTLSGGEPFCQPEALVELVDAIKDLGMDIIAYSGYTFDELLKMGETEKNIRNLLERCDVLIDGKFELENKTLALPFRGSTNQRIIDVKESIKTGKTIEKELK